MEDASEKAALLHGGRSLDGRSGKCGCGRTGRGQRIVRNRRRRRITEAKLRSSEATGTDENAENDGGTNHRQVKHEGYQSVMKSIFASLIVALFRGPVLGKNTRWLSEIPGVEMPITGSFGCILPHWLLWNLAAFAQRALRSISDCRPTMTQSFTA